jgi:hypothetical protein
MLIIEALPAIFLSTLFIVNCVLHVIFYWKAYSASNTYKSLFWLHVYFLESFLSLFVAILCFYYAILFLLDESFHLIFMCIITHDFSTTEKCSSNISTLKYIINDQYYGILKLRKFFINFTGKLYHIDKMRYHRKYFHINYCTK